MVYFFLHPVAVGIKSHKAYTTTFLVNWCFSIAFFRCSSLGTVWCNV